jgi:hypothetical protein
MSKHLHDITSSIIVPATLLAIELAARATPDFLSEMARASPARKNLC